MDSFISGLESFVRAADRLSFAEAGRALGISASAVGKNVARLEQQLGLRLFQRTTRQVRLTQEGRAVPRALPPHPGRAARCAGRHASRRPKRRAGGCALSLPTIGYRFLLPVLPGFQALYPEVDLDLDFNDHLVDVVEAGLDVVIRSGDLADSRLVARRLGPFRFVLVGSPAYLAEHGVPQSPADLARHRCLRYRFLGSGRLEEWVLPGLRRPCCPWPWPATTWKPCWARPWPAWAGGLHARLPGPRRPARGELQRVLAGQLTHTGQFSALWPSSRQLSPKVRAFVDYIGVRLFQAADEPPPGSPAANSAKNRPTRSTIRSLSLSSVATW